MILLLSTILVLYIFEFGFVHAQNYYDDSNNNEIDDDGDGLVDIADLDCQKDFLSRLPSMVSPFNLQ